MYKTLEVARQGYMNNEVPVASTIINSKTKEIIASFHNLTETENNPLNHSEILVINKACKILGTKYLTDCEIYVTLEPCIMCYTAICYAKIPIIYFAAFDNKKELRSLPKTLYKPEIYGGIMEKESEELLSKFFNKIRS
jgi:tRNA(adenine34) deaminase